MQKLKLLFTKVKFGTQRLLSVKFVFSSCFEYQCIFIQRNMYTGERDGVTFNGDNQLGVSFVVYFDQHLGAAHSKRWSK